MPISSTLRIFYLTTYRIDGEQPCSLRACSRDDPECGARCGVLRRRLVTAAPGGTGPRPPGTKTWLRGARCNRSGRSSKRKPRRAIRDESAAPGAKNRHGGAPGGVRPASWDARRLARRLACRAGTHHGCSAEHPNVSRRSAHPSMGVSEAKRQSPDAAMRARERVGLFDMVNICDRTRGYLCAVVPAKAGTHNHRPVFMGSRLSLRSAGTTRMHFGQTNPTANLAKRSQVATRTRRTNLRVRSPAPIHCFRLLLTMDGATPT